MDILPKNHVFYMWQVQGMTPSQAQPSARRHLAFDPAQMPQILRSCSSEHPLLLCRRDTCIPTSLVVYCLPRLADEVSHPFASCLMSSIMVAGGVQFG